MFNAGLQQGRALQSGNQGRPDSSSITGSGMPLDVALSPSLFVGSSGLVHATTHARLLSDSFFQAIFGNFIPVSYTHLTLPTKRIV